MKRLMVLGGLLALGGISSYTIGTFFGGLKGNIQTAYNELGKK